MIALRTSINTKYNYVKSNVITKDVVLGLFICSAISGVGKVNSINHTHGTPSGVGAENSPTV